MPQGFDKTSAAIAGSMEDMVNILRKASASGKKLKDTPENLAKKIMYKEHGSGSFALDALRKPLNKIFKGNVDKGIDKVQGKLTDLDMKAGKKVHEVLTKNPKGKVRNSLAKSFVQKHQINLEGRPNGTPDELLEIQAAGLSNPLAKARDVALPVAGAFAISNAISKSKSKEGEAVKQAYSRDELIEKIAKTIDSQKSSKVIQNKDEDIKEIQAYELFGQASLMLKFAAEKIKEYELSTEKLALENQRLYLENIAKERVDESLKLANEMNAKGFIKKADIEAKVDELSIMDEDAFIMFKEAVENIRSNNVQKDGVDNLTFMMDNNNIKYKKTLADSINDSANEI